MFVFCEECGQKMLINKHEKHSKSQKFKCSACGEYIRVCENKQKSPFHFSQKPIDSIVGPEPEPTQCFKIFIVDDSPMIRRAIGDILESSRTLKVVGEAPNGVEALRLIPSLNPDVVTLDINMPVMDGLTTLKHIMIKHPCPVVVISTLTREGASITFDALKLGAVDFITKPSRLSEKHLKKQKKEIVQKIIMASHVEMGEIRYLRSENKIHSTYGTEKPPLEYILTLGASEGGYSALLKIVPLLRHDVPAAVLVVLYTSEPAYVDTFARYLDENSFIHVRRAGDQEQLTGGTCYIASGDEYLTLEEQNGHIFLQVTPNPFPDRKGAVNMMMISASEWFGKNTLGAVLSGSGEDGVEGLREILRQEGIGMVQDPATCLCRDTVLSVLKKLPIDRVVSVRKMADEINRVLCLNYSIN